MHMNLNITTGLGGMDGGQSQFQLWTGGILDFIYNFTFNPALANRATFLDSTILSLQVSFFKAGLDIFGSIESIAPASARAQRVSAIAAAWLSGLNPETPFASDIF